MTGGYFTISQEDMLYLNAVSKFILLGELLFMFIIIYGTPAYLIIVILSKISNHFSIKSIKGATEDLETFFSAPLFFLRLGFCELYFIVKNIEMKEKKAEIRLLGANIVGFLLFLSFQLRQLENTVIILTILSLVLYFLASLWNILRSKTKI
jgi:hypothetical protein